MNSTSTSAALEEVRCGLCGVNLVQRPIARQTPEQIATGPWWDHPPVEAGQSLIGHTRSLTFASVVSA